MPVTVVLAYKEAMEIFSVSFSTLLCCGPVLLDNSCVVSFTVICFVYLQFSQKQFPLHVCA